MHDAAQVARLLLESAARLAEATRARAVLAAIDALPDTDAVPPGTILIARDTADLALIRRLRDDRITPLLVPAVELDRFGQVTLAAIVAISSRLIDLHDTAIFLTGPYRAMIDSVVVMSIGGEYEMFDTTEQPSIEEHIKRAVFHRVLSLALNLGQFGREGRRVGALLIVGDHRSVLEQSEQMILNPFKGYPDKQRNILDEKMKDTVREFCALDGAVIVRGNGVIETAGARIKTGLSAGLPSGLGSRHAAAAGITAATRSIAFTVSETDGTVRVWRAGRVVAAFEPAPR